MTGGFHSRPNCAIIVGEEAMEGETCGEHPRVSPGALADAGAAGGGAGRDGRRGLQMGGGAFPAGAENAHGDGGFLRHLGGRAAGLRGEGQSAERHGGAAEALPLHQGRRWIRGGGEGAEEISQRLRGGIQQRRAVPGFRHGAGRPGAAAPRAGADGERHAAACAERRPEDQPEHHFRRDGDDSAQSRRAGSGGGYC